MSTRRQAANRSPDAPRQYSVLALAGGDACKPIDHTKQIDQCANYALLEFIGDKGFVIFKPQEFFFQNVF